MRERGKNVHETLLPVMKTLIRKERLDTRYRPYSLRGEWEEHWEYHLKDDWLFIWHVDPDRDRITFVRTGTQDDLFG